MNKKHVLEKLLVGLMAWIAVFALAAAEPDEGTSREVMVVTAEGLSDGNFYKDRRVAYDEAIKDAKRQVLEKAVGAFVDSHTLVNNYQTISDTIYTKYQGFIKRVLGTVDGGVQADDFYHVWIKAEVSTQPLGNGLGTLSRRERVGIISDQGNPTFAVEVDVISDKTGHFMVRCEVCATEIATNLKNFGYKVVDLEPMRADIEQRKGLVRLEQGEIAAAQYGVGRKPVDVIISGQAKLRKSPPVSVAGMTVRTVVLTSWAVKAVATQTNEIIFSRNFRPSRKAFNDDDEAILAVGKEIGKLFSTDVFTRYVAAPTRSLLFSIRGLPDRQLAQDMKRDLLGARSITGVRFKDFFRNAEAVFEVDYVGSREEFVNYLDSELLTALNRKYGKGTFVVTQESGDRVEVKVAKPDNVTREILENGPPLSLTVASAHRAREVIKTQKTLDKVKGFNPGLSTALGNL
ncbi:MAG: hypothetical protein KJO08_10745 [Gammaproteobacteria bacterium]|nr:hypothetical protein [Gammaproteobacteria bacterium]NNJ83859.1 hypothetical protein [Gammaproteobacteria bacterium]